MAFPQGTPFGDYRLLSLLGEGGFAQVYEAEHIYLPGVKAAIKLLKGSFTRQQIENLHREALLVSKLEHPHIVQLRTFSITEDDTPYLVMAYAQGGALDQRHPRGSQLTLAQILSYARPVASALHYAHTQRVIHRDLKPANLLLTHDDRVQVADFGVAVTAHSSKSRTLQEIAGTWFYMAPEQFRGQAVPASDQYSLAIMIYEWLCGHVPFDGAGNMYQIPHQHEHDVPPSLCAQVPDLSHAIEKVVMRALAKEPKERFATIEEFVEALADARQRSFMPVLRQRLGDYRLLRKLGEGAFAEVYEAEHIHLGTSAAIKLLKGTFTPAQAERLRQEARAIIQLDHPHIIRAHGFSIEDQTPYLVMAYATGGSLAAQHELGTPLPLATIISYVQQIASALQYAHEQRIIHRDIKPENILLAQDGRLLIADFGIAIMAQATQPAKEISGSWLYIAPEQFRGRAEPASDQYSLAVMVYQWLCGELPFTGDGSVYAIPYQHMSEPPPSLCQRMATLSPRIEAVVMKALAKQPEERFASVLDFCKALEAASTALPITTHPVPAVKSASLEKVGRLQPPGATLFAHEHLGGANAVAWSPDGKRIASAGNDAAVQLWNAASGQSVLTLRGHTNWIRSVSWSPDGNRLASASDDGCVRLWEPRTGKPVQCYEGHTNWVRAVVWSPDGRRLASASDDKSVHIWSAITAMLLWRYSGHAKPVYALSWSPDGQWLASASDEGVQVWEASAGKLLRRYKGHAKPVYALSWSPDSQYLASASDDKSVHVWEAQTGKLLRRYKGHTGGVLTVSWSPNGKLLASASTDTSVHIWEAATGKALLTYRGHSTPIFAVSWSPDGRQIASAGAEVRIWVTPHS